MSAASVFTKIVCGVDGSPAGLEAVKQSQRLAPAGAELTLVSVSESHLAVHTGAAAGEWAQRLNDEARAALDDARELVDEAQTVLLHGRAADTFVQAFRDACAPLAAVCSHEISLAAWMVIWKNSWKLI